MSKAHVKGSVNIFHEATIEVDEEGTVATAATAAVMTTVGSAIVEQPPVFHADHPFLFLIRDKNTNEIFFIGHVVDPS